MKGLNFNVNVKENVDDAKLNETLEKVEEAKMAAQRFSKAIKELKRATGIESTIEIPEEVFLELLGSYLNR